MFKCPEELKYAKTHEWVKEEDGLCVVGLTDFAQDALGDIVFVNLPVVGDEVKAGESFADVESVKAVSDVYAPVSGAASQEGVTVEGYVRTPEEKVQSAIAGARRQMVEAAARSFSGETDRYIDLLATRISLYEIIIGIFPIVYVLGLLFLGPKVYRLLAGKLAGKIVGGGVLILAFVYIGFVIHVYMMIM